MRHSESTLIQTNRGQQLEGMKRVVRGKGLESMYINKICVFLKIHQTEMDGDYAQRRRITKKNCKKEKENALCKCYVLINFACERIHQSSRTVANLCASLFTTFYP